MTSRVGRTVGRALAAAAGAAALLLAAAGGAETLRRSVEGPSRVAVDPSPHATDPATDPPAAVDATPTDTPTATPTDTPTAPAESFDEMIIDEITAQVSRVRELDITDSVDARVMDGDTLADKIGELIAEEQDLEQLEVDRRILVALRLIPEDLDLEQLLDDLYREQVAGV
ncbi:MAG TPA: hypothetical protein VML96_00440 [Egibacteraceae bacterium]|nr:hypothetical protein [Egibacteraceae bacterium]